MQRGCYQGADPRDRHQPTVILIPLRRVLDRTGDVCIALLQILQIVVQILSNWRMVAVRSLEASVMILGRSKRTAEAIYG